MASTVEYRPTEGLPDGVDCAIAAKCGRVVFLVRSTLTVPDAMKVMTAVAAVYMLDTKLVEFLCA